MLGSHFNMFPVSCGHSRAGVSFYYQSVSPVTQRKSGRTGTGEVRRYGYGYGYGSGAPGNTVLGREEPPDPIMTFSPPPTAGVILSLLSVLR